MRETLLKILRAVSQHGYCDRAMMPEVSRDYYWNVLKILRAFGCIEIDEGKAKPGPRILECLDLLGSDFAGYSHVYVLFGDIHVGRKTPSYNYSVACMRVKKLVRMVEMLKQSGVKVYILGLGDYVDGEGIYGRQAYEQEFDPNTQFIRFVELAKPLVELSDGFYGIVGNHGRTSERDIGNYDYLALESLRVAVGGKVVASKRYADVFEVNGDRVLLAHAKFRMSYGIPDYSIRRFVQSQVLYHGKINIVALGHYHVFKAWREGNVLVVMNGTFLSDDELSYQTGLRPSISQALIYRIGNDMVVRELSLGTHPNPKG
ncbi:MAG: metallophosphoesterase [Thermofilaceae archaeon]